MEYKTQNTIFILSVIFSFTAAFLEGDSCVMVDPKEGNGKCVSLNKCPYALQRLQTKKIQPQSCGFSITDRLICCPSSTLQKPSVTYRSEKKCQEYHDPRSPRRRPTIAFGTQAKPREFPHMTALGYGNTPSDNLWLCGGSLISEKFVLTAGHCTYNREFGNPKWARVGDLNLNDTTEDAKPQDIEVLKVYAHPDYKPPSNYNDLALLKLKQNVRFNFYIAPACIHTEKTLPSGQLEAIGWGKIDFFGDASPHLMKVFLNVVQHKQCAKVFQTTPARQLARGIDDESQICAGDASGKDTCPGDSGGPLHFLNNGTSTVLKHFVVVGITSFGKACGTEDSCGVYTRVSFYRSWIENIVWPGN